MLSLAQNFLRRVERGRISEHNKKEKMTHRKCGTKIQKAQATFFSGSSLSARRYREDSLIWASKPSKKKGKLVAVPSGSSRLLKMSHVASRLLVLFPWAFLISFLSTTAWGRPCSARDAKNRLSDCPEHPMGETELPVPVYARWPIWVGHAEFNEVFIAPVRIYPSRHWAFIQLSFSFTVVYISQMAVTVTIYM